MVALTLLAAMVYLLVNSSRPTPFNHFVWQAQALLDGDFAIRWPVHGEFANWYLQDVMPLPDRPGYGLLPFPPLPAVLLIPFVAVFGLATDQTLLAVLLGALNVALTWRMVTRITPKPVTAAVVTAFFAFGTVHFYAAMLGSTWFLAHVVATTFLLIGITFALDGERQELVRLRLRQLGAAVPRRLPLDGVQLVAGLIFGVAALARLPVIFGLPFFVFVGGGGSYRKRALSAGLGAVLPVALLGLYNLVSSGHVFNPAYDWLYVHQTENLGYAPPGLEGNREWGPEHPFYIPINAIIMFAWPPTLLPYGTECGLGLLNPDCPVAIPSQFGMSIVLTSPAYLLALPIVLAAWRDRLVLGSALAVLAIGVVNLAHFSQGWVQFGYRFSNDFAPFALVLVTVAIARLGVLKLAVALVAASILVNAWGVYWGVTLRW